jgi:hypothetical protein
VYSIALCAVCAVGHLGKVHSGQQSTVFLFQLRAALVSGCSASKFANPFLLLIAAVFHKSLRLSQLGKQHESTGKILNLVASDCQKLMDFPTGEAFLFSDATLILQFTRSFRRFACILELSSDHWCRSFSASSRGTNPVALAVAHPTQVGVAALAGLATMLALLPVVALVSARMSTAHDNTTNFGDQRIRTIGDVLTG